MTHPILILAHSTNCCYICKKEFPPPGTPQEGTVTFHYEPLTECPGHVMHPECHKQFFNQKSWCPEISHRYISPEEKAEHDFKLVKEWLLDLEPELRKHLLEALDAEKK